MNMEFRRKLPIPKEVKEMYPISEELAKIKEKRDNEIKAVFSGKGKNCFHQSGCRATAPPRFFQTDTEYPAMAHAIASAVQTCRADDLAIYLGEILHIVR